MLNKPIGSSRTLSLGFFNLIIMEEIWKDVVGYEGSYQVSSMGRVKSLKFGKDIILKQRINECGYFIVTLSNGTARTHKVHGLVSSAFLNHKPDGHQGLVCNHINFNRTDNRLENLELVSSRENSNQKHIAHSSSFTGVCWNKLRGKWRAQVRINGKKKYLGLFTDELEASQAYEKALKTI